MCLIGSLVVLILGTLVYVRKCRTSKGTREVKESEKLVLRFCNFFFNLAALLEL